MSPGRLRVTGPVPAPSQRPPEHPPSAHRSHLRSTIVASWYQSRVKVLNTHGAPVLLPRLRRPSAHFVAEASQHPSASLSVTDHFTFRGYYRDDIEAANALADELLHRYPGNLLVSFVEHFARDEREWRMQLVVDRLAEPAVARSFTTGPHPPVHIVAKALTHQVAMLVVPRLRR